MEKNTGAGQKEAISLNLVDENWKWWQLSPIFAILMIVPLIVFFKEVPLNDFLYHNWTGQKNHMDFFNYHKSRVFILLTLVAFVIFIFQISLHKCLLLKKSRIFVPLGLYAFCVLLSALHSPYQEIVYLGFIDRYEGLFVLFSYCFIAYYVFLSVNSEKYVRLLLNAFAISAFVLCLIGFLQYFGYDLFKSQLGKELILPASQANFFHSLAFRFDPRVIYSTLSNYNYVGSYIAIFFPIIALLATFVRNIKPKIVYILLSTLTGFVWVACNARSGLVAVTAALIVFLALMLRKLFRNFKLFLQAGIVILLVLCVLGFFAKDALIKRYKSSKAEIQGLLTSFSKSGKQQQKQAIGKILVRDHEVDLIVYGKDIHLAMSKDGTVFYSDGKGNGLDIEMTLQAGVYAFKNKEYQGFKNILARINGKMTLILEKEQVKIFLCVHGKKFDLVNQNGAKTRFEPIESIGFKGMESFASARGYIWSRSVPLIKKAPLLGFGPDTFCVVFPQNDYNGKIIAYSDMHLLVDKAHNYFLQTAIGNGLISLGALLLFFIWYFLQSVKLYFDCDTDKMINIYGMGCFLGVVGYLTAGLFNDSTITVAPVFWIIIGLGLAINRMVIGNGNILS